MRCGRAIEAAYTLAFPVLGYTGDEFIPLLHNASRQYLAPSMLGEVPDVLDVCRGAQVLGAIINHNAVLVVYYFRLLTSHE